MPHTKPENDCHHVRCVRLLHFKVGDWAIHSRHATPIFLFRSMRATLLLRRDPIFDLQRCNELHSYSPGILMNKLVPVFEHMRLQERNEWRVFDQTNKKRSEKAISFLKLKRIHPSITRRWCWLPISNGINSLFRNRGNHLSAT